MASAKQIAWRKKFAKMAKSGKFKKKKTRDPYPLTTRLLLAKKSKKSNPHNETVKFMGLEKTKKSIPDYIMAEAMNDGFEIPSGWFSMSKSMQLGFLKKFARRTY